MYPPPLFYLNKSYSHILTHGVSNTQNISKWSVKGCDNSFHIYADGDKRYALAMFSTVKMVNETFGYVECQTLVDKKKVFLGLEFSDSGRTKHAFKKIQDVIRILSLKDEWDCISSVHPGDSRFFDGFLPDDIWTEYDSKIDMKRAKDYISCRPSESLACSVAFTCGDEQTALNDRGDIKAGPVLEHKLLFNPNDEDDRKHGADWCRARVISLKSIEYPQNWNGENTKEHRKRGGRFVPWDHQITKLYNRVFPTDVGYVMRRPEQPPASPGDLEDVLMWRDPDVKYHSFIAQAVDPMLTVTYVSLSLSHHHVLKSVLHTHILNPCSNVQVRKRIHVVSSGHKQTTQLNVSSHKVRRSLTRTLCARDFQQVLFHKDHQRTHSLSSSSSYIRLK